MELYRQEYRSGQPFLSPGSFPDPGTEPESPAFQAYSLPSEHQGNPEHWYITKYNHEHGKWWKTNGSYNSKVCLDTDHFER